ncbi:hypothetical protein Scep_014300 [Stephania cephalantha]|uniref:Uncharacterized protein n=1 Tax=Stephania cephalantha TaxID=152367 RepID=A0AAP0P0F5_9MAGN
MCVCIVWKSLRKSSTGSLGEEIDREDPAPSPPPAPTPASPAVACLRSNPDGVHPDGVHPSPYATVLAQSAYAGSSSKIRI